MIPYSITTRYASPVFRIQYAELQPLLRRHNGRLVSCGYYPLLECNEGKWSLVAGYERVLLVFKPTDVLVVYGECIDIWHLYEDESYFLKDSIGFNSSVLAMQDAIEEPLL